MITEEKIEAVCAELCKGCSYKKACKRVGIKVHALRVVRYGDPAVMRRCAAARSTGLCARADKLRYVIRTKGATLQPHVSAMLEARAKRLLGEAERITRR